MQPQDVLHQHLHFVRALAFRLAPEPSVAEDIAQQVFVEFLQKAPQWDLSKDVRPLLATMTHHIAKRCWREHGRLASPKMRELAEHIQRIAGEQPENLYNDDEREALRRCLEKLPEKSRELLRGHYTVGLSSAELAQSLETSADSVRQALCRIRMGLRRCMARQSWRAARG